MSGFRKPGRRLLAGLVAASGLALAVAACGDEGPSGPGSLRGTVVSPGGAEGAAVIELPSRGITGVEAAPGTRVFHSPIPSGGGADAGAGDPAPAPIRIVVMRPDGGELAFTVEVEDVGAPPPAGTVLEVVGSDNSLRGSVSGYSVRFEAGP